jgi:hypothetical protein
MQRRLGYPKQSSSGLALGRIFTKMVNLRKNPQFCLQGKTLFVGFTVIALADFLGAEVTLVILDISDPMTLKS